MNRIQQFLATKLLGIPLGDQAGGFSSFEGANMSTARTMVLNPPPSAKKQVTPYTRKQLLGKYHWARNNIGLVKRMVRGSARYAIGQGVSPKAMTTDEVWNKAHDEWFEAVALNPSLFDYEGRLNFYRSQRVVAESMMGEGELFTNVVERDEAEFYLPQFQLLASHRVDNARSLRNPRGGITGNLKDETFDGLGLDPVTNRVLFYRVPRENGEEGYDDLDAEHVIHTYDPERVGMLRGLTWLYHGTNSLIDIMDLTALEKHAVKVHSSLAAVVKNKMGNTGTAGLTGQLEALLSKTQQQALASVSPEKKNQLLEKIFGGGIVPFLNSDEELELLTSDRPSPVFTGFLDWLVRDIAWGFGVSPEFIWAVAGMGGANTRFILADAQWFFTDVMNLVVDMWAAPVRNKMVAAAMLAHQRNPALGLPECKDPNWRTKIHWQGPPKITADPGKEAQSSIALMANGMNTWGDFWGGQGASGREKIIERLREVAQAILDLETVRKELDPTGTVLTPEVYNFDKIITVGAGKPGGPPSNDPLTEEGKQQADKKRKKAQEDDE